MESDGAPELYAETYVASNYIDMAKETVCPNNVVLEHMRSKKLLRLGMMFQLLPALRPHSYGKPIDI